MQKQPSQHWQAWIRTSAVGGGDVTLTSEGPLRNTLGNVFHHLCNIPLELVKPYLRGKSSPITMWGTRSKLRNFGRTANFTALVNLQISVWSGGRAAGHGWRAKPLPSTELSELWGWIRAGARGGRKTITNTVTEGEVCAFFTIVPQCRRQRSGLGLAEKATAEGTRWDVSWFPRGGWCNQMVM